MIDPALVLCVCHSPVEDAVSYAVYGTVRIKAHHRNPAVVIASHEQVSVKGINLNKASPHSANLFLAGLGKIAVFPYCE